MQASPSDTLKRHRTIDMMMRSLKFITLCSCLLLLVACLPSFQHPLSEIGAEKIDQSIFGSWYFHAEEETGFIHIGLNDQNPATLHIVMLDIDHNRNIEINEFTGHTTKLGKRRYLNLREKPGEDVDSSYLLLKYSVNQESLNIAFINPTLVKKAIKEGRIKGKIQDEFLFSSLLVTEKTRKLKRYIRKNDQALFPESSRLQKFTAQSIDEN